MGLSELQHFKQWHVLAESSKCLYWLLRSLGSAAKSLSHQANVRASPHSPAGRSGLAESRDCIAILGKGMEGLKSDATPVVVASRSIGRPRAMISAVGHPSQPGQSTNPRLESPL